MVDDGKQPLSADKQVIPGQPGVTVSLPGVSVDDIRASVEPRLTPGDGLGLNSHLHKLDAQKLAIALAHHWPNLTAAAKELGVWPDALHHHKRKGSPWFMAIWEQAKLSALDRIKGVMMEQAQTPKGFLDRAMTLRAYEPDVFNPARKIIVEGHKMSESDAERRSKVLDNCVDATIVNAYTTRKERNQAKREGSSLLPSGESEGGGVRE